MEQMLIDSAERILRDGCDKALLDSAEAGEFPQALASLLIDNGFDQLGAPDSGTSGDDAYGVLRVAGRFALPVPLAEWQLARLLGVSGYVSVGRMSADGSSAFGVPWARQCERVIGVSDDGRARLFTVAQCRIEPEAHLAGESRASVTGDSEPIDAPADVFGRMALSRVALSVGALEHVLELAITYVTEREQFGRTLSKFQSLQHYLAIMAADVAAAARATDAAIVSLETERFPLDVAAAKSRVGEATNRVAELAHQVHGAMGFTHEHQLHHFTRRLWAWRDEFGDEVFWQQRLGRHIAAAGPDEVWPFLATGG